MMQLWMKCKGPHCVENKVSSQSHLPQHVLTAVLGYKICVRNDSLNDPCVFVPLSDLTG